MTKSKPYERLTKSRFWLNGMGSLWLGDDHILLVTNALAVERYRRWYLRDIQAFVLRRNAARLIWNIVIGLFAIIAAGITVTTAFWAWDSSSSGDKTFGFVIAGVFAAIMLLFLFAIIVNTAMGPSCAVFVQTPHGLDRISSPNRVVAFEKLHARLSLLIDLAQAPAGQEGLREVATALDQPVA